MLPIGLWSNIRTDRLFPVGGTLPRLVGLTTTPNKIGERGLQGW
jgi:hypothetical protein